MLKKNLISRFIVISVIMAAVAVAQNPALPPFPGDNPGNAHAAAIGKTLTLSNDALELCWSISDNGLFLKSITDNFSGKIIPIDKPAFEIILGGDPAESVKNLQIVQKPRINDLAPISSSVIYSSRMGGYSIQASFLNPKSGLKILWEAALRNESNYIRQKLSLLSSDKEIPVKEVVLLDIPLDADKFGEVQGSPVVADDLFFAIEHPLALNDVEGKNIKCRLKTSTAVSVDSSSSLEVSSVIGVAPKGQLRRAFLYYLERERAHPYRHFIHYNSWFHLNIGRPDNRMTREEAVSAIANIGEELTGKRKVVLDSFVMDDGWDDFNSLWGFHDGFPNGFTEIADKARQFHSSVGVWMSPWGGYGKPKEKRIAFGKKAGYETNDRGFSMGGAKYFAAFRDTCLSMIEKYGANYFKFDGMGSGSNAAGTADELSADIAAILRLSLILHDKKPDLFINATTGTWPSPFWTFYADSIWRQGSDTGFAGVGNTREQWITYRDKNAFENIVFRAPLYPLNSLMYHGIVIGERSHPAKMVIEENSIRNEIRSLFGSGTGLQELYISPHLLTEKMWNDLADSAKWFRDNHAVLVDTHWIGGNPGKLEIYGWAAWSPGKGTITLRNPDEKEAGFTLDIIKALELPPGYSSSFTLKTPYPDQRIKELKIKFGEPQEIILQPFEVLVFDLKGAE
ncbi:enterotoxin [Candidatus Sumerlaeota bacterium]|nr:enterotoxin [Candidatus Sumerlaeota bacterium]